MDRISYNSLKIINFFENLNPKTSGVIFSTLIHLIILLFMVGLPNFFSPKEIYVPNVIPIEILNVDENTNLKKSDTEKPENKNKETITKQKKFNSSDQLEVKKNVEINKTEIVEKTNPNQPVLEMKQTPNLEVKETKKVIKYLLVGQRVWQLAFTPDQKTLLSTNGVSNDVSFINVDKLKVEKSIKVGRFPWGVVISPQ